MTTALCITITGSLSAFVAEYKIELLIAFIGFAGTILGAVIQKAKKKISALSQKKLRKLISRKLEQAGSEPLFFETVTAKKEYQYYQKKIRIKNVPLFDASSGRKIGKVNESACSIIKGEAGIGKSILADNIFYRRNKRIRRWIFERLLKQYCLKISFQDLQNPELTELLSNAECRKLCLIIDGFDEASDDAGRVKQGIRALQKLCDANKVNLLLFGRTEFVDKSLKSFRELRTLFQTVYVLKQWDRQTLDLYSTNLINHYGKKRNVLQ